ncbi:MAG: thiamine phosphate synthase [Pseudomonadota bacterium]
MIKPGLYLIIHLDWHIRDSRSPVELCRKALRGGCSAVQLRFKKAPDAAVVRAARDLRRVTAGANVPLIINDRPDIAAVCGADGVHVGQEDLPPEVVAGHWDGLIVGLSTHDLKQVRRAGRQAADYIGFGPVFGTKSKKILVPATGIAFLEKAVAASRLPLVAIGGINEKNCGRVAAAGAMSAAVLSCIYRSANPGAAAKAIHETFAR